jgi:predicted nucleic acid-binding protein
MPEQKSALQKLEKMVLNGHQFYVNTIIISETYHILTRMIGEDEALMRTQAILSSQYIKYLPISSELISAALLTSHSQKIRINDAIIAIQALSDGDGIFTDNIKDFNKIKGLHIIPLREGTYLNLQ